MSRIEFSETFRDFKSGYPRSDIGAQIFHLRCAVPLKQYQFANLIGYTPGYISKVENGDLTPSEDFILKAVQVLSSALGRPLSWDGDRIRECTT